MQYLISTPLLRTGVRVASVTAIAGLTYLAYYTILSVRADNAFRENSPVSLRLACRLIPESAVYHALLAEHMEAAGVDPDQELRIATELSPRQARYWIRRSFRAEVEQKFAESERYLIEAKRVDNGFDPPWALANFYFRRGRTTDFWAEMRDALKMSYGDPDPIFRLGLAMNDDSSLLKDVLPPRRDVQLAFVAYLMQNNDINSAAQVAESLAAGARIEEETVFLNYCETQTRNNTASALKVWNSLCQRNLVPFQALSPLSGRVVTNGEFAAGHISWGFDWRYSGTDAVSYGQVDASLLRGLAININGQQPDSTILLEQILPLAPGSRYTIGYEYQLAGATGDSGLRWTVFGTGSNATEGSEPLATSSVLSGTEWTNGGVTFPSGNHELAILRLEYRRMPGTVRWIGTLRIRRVVSALAGNGPAH